VSQSLDYAAFGAAMIGLLGTIIGMIVWMVKLSAKRSQDITDRFIKHLEDAAEAKSREDSERAVAKAAEDAERALERGEFLQAIKDHALSMTRMADQQKEVAERLSDVVTEVRGLATEVKELANEVAHIKESQTSTNKKT